jgi:16S rRNA (cytidine1402-2'-O)-methyltransferase
MLYLIATPIGNLADISHRALDTLREADYIASEDTRKTGRLLKHFDIKAKQLSFHEHNKTQACKRILHLLQQDNSVALVTSAGTPGISDPGFVLVRAAIEADIEVTMVPGPCALIMALVLSGLAVHSFVFKGFAPRKKGQRRKFLEADRDLPYTLIYYESPFRLKSFLQDAAEVFGDRDAAVCKELTKMFETINRGKLSDLLTNLKDKPKGEYVIVITGKKT